MECKHSNDMLASTEIHVTIHLGGGVDDRLWVMREANMGNSIFLAEKDFARSTRLGVVCSNGIVLASSDQEVFASVKV